ncbi:MAG: adenylate/guanylate cyclase domain-containing protein [Actinobacteria bacterium]|uniref:Unannotated protein n=1 Tax=freshwater metagenome TaxID=449393 RepID=A0A6J6QVD7_9ZZZZ|nr:adenylate/guanylate cyclase domain-containing protein [Actinomycetota bacterium]
MVVTLVVVCVALMLGLVASVALLLDVRRQLDESRRLVTQLESDLDAALRPSPPASAAERAMRAVVGTAARVRTHGITGMLSASMDDLTTWALEKRPDILQMTAADGTVTIFFSDIEDSTAHNHRLGDRAWVKVLEAHDAVVRGAVERHRGQVVKTAGDSFMVAFRDPVSALLAARSIQRTLARTLDPRLRLTPVRVRIGVHCGRVISRDGDYFGRNVAHAARVAALADGGEVLVSDPVREQTETSDVEHPLEFEAAFEEGEIELKGLPGTHQIWRLVVET